MKITNIYCIKEDCLILTTTNSIIEFFMTWKIARGNDHKVIDSFKCVEKNNKTGHHNEFVIEFSKNGEFMYVINSRTLSKYQWGNGTFNNLINQITDFYPLDPFEDMTCLKLGKDESE